MKRAAVMIVSKLHNFEQKQRRMVIAQEMLTTCNNDPDLLKKFITNDESGVYGYDIETKAQSYHFVMMKEVREKSKQELFQMCFVDWEKRWLKCIITILKRTR